MNSNYNRSKIFLIIALIILFLFTIYIKYDNQSLSLSDFNLLLMGNILTTFLYLVIIVEILIFFKKHKTNISKSIILLILSFVFIGLGYYSINVQLPFNKYYFFGQYGNKLFTGFCFTLYLLTIIYFAFYIFYSKKSKKIFNLRAFVSSIVVMISFLFLSYFYIVLNENKLNEKSIDNTKKNILIVLGAAVWSDNKPSPILASRVKKSVKLSKNKSVDKIYFTGGNAPGEKSEAEVAYYYFKRLNPNFNKIEIETSTSSTIEQIQFIKNIILPKYSEYEIIVISDSFHLVRIKEISNFNRIKIKTIASDFSMSIKSNIYNRIRESLALSIFWLFSI